MGDTVFLELLYECLGPQNGCLLFTHRLFLLRQTSATSVCYLSCFGETLALQQCVHVWDRVRIAFQTILVLFGL